MFRKKSEYELVESKEVIEIPMKKSRKLSKLVVGTLAVVTTVAFGASMSEGGVKGEVISAFTNTMTALESETSKESEIYEKGDYEIGYQFVIDQIDSVSDSNGVPETQSLLTDIGNIQFDVVMKSDAENMQYSIGGGLVGYTPFQSDIFITSDKLLIALPELYKDNFYVSMDAMNQIYEGTPINTSQFQPEMWEDLFTYLGTELSVKGLELLNKASFEKTSVKAFDAKAPIETTTVEIGDPSWAAALVLADEVKVTVPKADFEAFIHSIPDMVNADPEYKELLNTFAYTYLGTTDIEEVLEACRTFTIEGDVSEILLGYVYISNNRVVQVKLPLGTEDVGTMTISLLGQERMSDFLHFTLNSSEQVEPVMILSQKMEQDNFDIYCNMTMVDSNALDLGSSKVVMELYADGTTKFGEDRVDYAFDRMDVVVSATAEYAYEGVVETDSDTVTVGMTGSCYIKNGEPIVVPTEAGINLMEVTDEQMAEVAQTIMTKVLEGNYLPEALIAQLTTSLY